MVIINLIAFLIYDKNPVHPNAKLNSASFFIELICNIYFLIDFLLQIIVFGCAVSVHSYLRKAWNVPHFISIIFR